MHGQLCPAQVLVYSLTHICRRRARTCHTCAPLEGISTLVRWEAGLPVQVFPQTGTYSPLDGL